MKLYQYESYDEYVKVQERANKAKIRNVWVNESTINNIHRDYGGSAQTILCHGTRNAAEQNFFKRFYPFAEIVGTEISSTASQFPMTVQWDFSEEKKEWKEKFDIVYSNSFDHSYDPIKTLLAWKGQVSKKGKLYLEHGYSPLDNKSKDTDPLEIASEELVEMLEHHGLEIERTFDSYGLNKTECVSRIYVCRVVS